MFNEPVDGSAFASVDGVREIHAENHHVSFSFDGKMDELLAVATRDFTLLDITSEEADLEEIFLTYYRDEEVEA